MGVIHMWTKKSWQIIHGICEYIYSIFIRSTMTYFSLHFVYSSRFWCHRRPNEDAMIRSFNFSNKKKTHSNTTIDATRVGYLILSLRYRSIVGPPLGSSPQTFHKQIFFLLLYLTRTPTTMDINLHDRQCLYSMSVTNVENPMHLFN